MPKSVGSRGRAGSAGLGAARGPIVNWAERVVAGCVANIGLKLVSLVIAIIVYVLVRRADESPAPLPPPAPPAPSAPAPPACVP